MATKDEVLREIDDLNSTSDLYKPDEDIEIIRSKIMKDYGQAIFLEMDNEKTAYSTRRAQEKAILHYISTGDILKISALLDLSEKKKQGKVTTDSMTVGAMSDIPKLQALGLLISGITLYTRAAIDGGLPEHMAYALSDSYIKNSITLNNITEINEITNCALFDFTNEVYKYKYKDCSLLIRTCCEYITRHLHDEITLSTLSTLTHKSANYISDSFYKELGIRPTEFIRNQKLDYAKSTLEIADLSITALSDLLSFPSPSAFIAYFKKRYEVTPMEYKKQHFH